MITNPQRNLIANFLFGKNLTETELSLISPEKFYIGLSSEVLDASGNISGELSLDGTGYKRIEIDNSSAVFGEASDGVVKNSVKEVRWETALTDWQVLSVFISPYSASQAGDYAMYVTNIEINVPAGVNLYYDINALQLSIEAGE